jgi:hypothetical protein
MMIERAYHDLMWLARTWGVTLADIAYLAENDLLQLCVRVFDEAVSDGPVAAEIAGAEEVRQYSGLLGLRTQDAFALFRDGEALIEYLVDREGQRLRLVIPKFVLMGDLVVRDAERQRFERLQPGSKRAVVGKDCFKSFRWEGRSYTFTHLQARFLHRLYDAGLTGQVWANGKATLSDIGSALVKPGDLFRRKPLWRDIVDHDQQGNYRMQPSFMAHPPW